MATSKFSSRRLGVFRASHFDNQFLRTLSFAIYGGYIVLRGAIFDLRVKACIANPGWLDKYTFFRQGLPAFTHNMTTETAARIWQISANFWKLGRFAANQFKLIYGVNTTEEILETLKLYNNRGLEEQITCPLLLLAGAGEGEELLSQQEELLAKVRSPAKKLRIFKETEGADAHCITNNLMLHNQIVFDWLAEIGMGLSGDALYVEQYLPRSRKMASPGI